MQIILSLSFIVVLYLGLELAIIYFRFKTLPQLQAIDQSDKTLGKGTVIRYIAAGDSTAAGLGASRAEKSYSYRIASFLAQTHQVEYRNIAETGLKTQDVLEKQLSLIIDYRPDVISISMGGNDSTHMLSKNKIFQNYKSIINRLKTGTTAHIYITDTQHYMSKIPKFWIARILPWLYIRILQLRYDNLNDRILALEDERVKIINIFGHAPFKNRRAYYATDYYHPNDEGYENWAAEFIKKINAK